MNLTPRQLDTYNAIARLTTPEQVAPTLDEIAADLGVSKVSVFGHITALEQKKLLTRDKFKARSIVLLPLSHGWSAWLREALEALRLSGRESLAARGAAFLPSLPKGGR